MNREARKRLYDALQAGRMIAQFTDGRLSMQLATALGE